MELNKWTEDQIIQGKKAFMNMAKHLMSNFVIDDRNREIVNDLFFYFHKIEGGKLDPEKGLWLEGDVGTGKSTILEIFSQHLRRYWNGAGFKIYNCATISNEYAFRSREEGKHTMYDANPDVLDKYTYNRYGYKAYSRVHMCFDELGREPIPAIHFGQKLNVMEHILHIRYTFWQSERLLTYVTTNKDADEIELLYQDYIRDRRAEMFNIIAMTGESRRK